MAGPLSSEEIEDVVSSVRRLVSNEQSARRLSRDLNGERLLLTPSLRVVSETSPLIPLVLATPVDTPTATDAPSEPAEEPADLVEAEWEDEVIWGPPEASLGEVALAAEEAEVILPAAEDAADTLAEAEDEALPDVWPEPELPPDGTAFEPTQFVPLRQRAENLVARLAAREVEDQDAAGQDDDALQTDEVRPGDEPQDEVFPDAHMLADAAEEDDGAAQRMPTEIVDADGTPLAVIDEGALQEIVRLMIREELQGDLGERITRNVRKLVRAEINRALVARDLD